MSFSLVIIFIVAAIAFALSAVCGGGASFILLPLLGWILPAAQVPAALSLGTAASGVSRIAIFYRNIRWDIVVWFVPPAIPSVWLGAKLLNSVDPILLELLIGLFLVINIPFIFKSKITKEEKDQGEKWKLCLIGVATGFLSGLTGAVGLLFNRFYLTCGLSKEEIIATRAANELLLHILKIVLYCLFGLVNVKVLLIGLVTSIAAVISAWGLKNLLGMITEKVFKRIGFSAMVTSGIFMLVSAGAALYNERQFRFSVYQMDQGMETKMRWKQSNFALEFEYNEGVEMERTISFPDLPVRLQKIVKPLISNADRVVLEEVHAINKHYYEVYLYQDGKLVKHDLY
jgi:uncharacterized membrane protein YfcA